MPSLKDMIGEIIVAHVPLFHKTKWQRLKLLDVETAGIWVESQSITESILQASGVTSSPKTMIFFLPFHQILYILSSRDVPALSEKAFLG